MAMGCWKTPEVELEYLEMELEEQLKFDRKLRLSSVTSKALA
jgi:hypothetical protein